MDILSGNGKYDMNFYDLINSEAQRKAGDRGRELVLERKMTNGFLENHSSNLYSQLWGYFAESLFQTCSGMNISKSL